MQDGYSNLISVLQSVITFGFHCLFTSRIHNPGSEKSISTTLDPLSYRSKGTLWRAKTLKISTLMYEIYSYILSNQLNSPVSVNGSHEQQRPHLALVSMATGSRRWSPMYSHGRKNYLYLFRDFFVESKLFMSCGWCFILHSFFWKILNSWLGIILLQLLLT